MGKKRDEVTGGRSFMICASPQTFGLRNRRDRWAGYVALIVKEKCLRIFDRQP